MNCLICTVLTLRRTTSTTVTMVISDYLVGFSYYDIAPVSHPTTTHVPFYGETTNKSTYTWKEPINNRM
ncbi:unnamed protein product [Caenorhabditis auriculariae]|uniref:Uncharacterized protein n=1 Tax=Caenorhabditis auriculariae TaxID=2777116 RepID=A0A8S1H1L8_9PELO|nr:unnamed protein product [Caenorhabditis auriculariae]